MLGMVALLAGCGDATQSGAQQARVDPVKVPGQLTYQRFCFSCHASGAAGAPRMGDVAAWAARIAKGESVLIESTIQGIPPGMPPRGLCMQCSDEELAATVLFMLKVSR
jgi:cytochrome c5